MSGRIIRQEPSSRLGLSIIGNVKIGEKKPNEKFPRSVDYFIPTGSYASHFTRAFGEKPNTIQVIFISDDPQSVCNESYEYRDDQGRVWGKGDGVEFLIWNEKQSPPAYQSFNILEHPDLCERLHQKVKSRRGWEVTLQLRFILPKIRTVVGLWQFTTKGAKSTIPNIVETFDTVKKHRGSVNGVVFDLNVAFAKSQKPGESSRFPVVTMVPNNSAENLEELKKNILNQNTNLLNEANEQ